MTPAPQHAPTPLPDAAVDASATLAREIAARPEWTIPCVAAADPAPWTSDDAEETAWAAEECAACPVLSACARFGVATRATGVVLAGIPWTPATAGNLRQRGITSLPALRRDPPRKDTT